MKIYNNFAEIADNFDTLLVDAYGVFWSGSDFYLGSREIMAQEVAKGKRLCILSNASIVSSAAIVSYQKKGLQQGIHFSDFITSGDVAKSALINKKLDFTGDKIYILGTPNLALFDGTDYKIVDEPEYAEAFYLSVPQLRGNALDALEQYKENLFLSTHSRENDNLWDSLIVEPFLPMLEKMLRFGLTAINANPDFRAFERPKNQETAYPMVRQGMLAQAYRDMGGKVVEFGKPHNNIFEYAFNRLNIEPSSRVAMIGDTYRTDIVGARNVGLAPVWCVETGMTRYECEQGKTIAEICGNDCSDIYMIKALG